MVKDSFTGKDIPRGTGLMLVRKDGSILYFAGKKSEKNFLKLKRTPKNTKWTDFYQKEKKALRGKAGKKEEEKQETHSEKNKKQGAKK